MSFSVVIRTGPRASGQSYLDTTVENLKRANAFSCGLMRRLLIFDTDQPQHHTPNQNAIRALRAACGVEADWILFLEDDLDFCGNFLESVDAWLSDFEREAVKFYPLCAAYKEVSNTQEVFWYYPVSKFYGTQAYAIRPNDAKKLVEFLSSLAVTMPEMTQGHDLQIAQWAAKTHTHFITPRPSFVQHIGAQTSLNCKFFTFGSWPGRNWNYIDSLVMPAHVQAKRKLCSTKLVDLLSGLFDKKRCIVYDFGCSTGKYMDALQNRGFQVLGYEGTPGIQQITKNLNIREHNLTKPLPLPKDKGNVMCIEVAEHITSKFEAVFLSTVTSHCKEHLVISWATPGQGGWRHVNEKPQSYVVPRIESFGFKFDKNNTAKFRELAKQDFFWFRKSLYVFTRVPMRLANPVVRGDEGDVQTA